PSSQRLAPSQQAVPVPRQASDADRPPDVATSRTGVTLRENVLSLDIRDQALRTVIERIATQGDIEVRHLQELPDKRISIRFTALPVVDGLKRLLRVADLPGYMLIIGVEGGQTRVQRILFLPGEQGNKRSRLASRPPRAQPPSRSRPVRATTPPRRPADKDKAAGDEEGGRSVFDVIKSNTTARRLLSQLVHPNEQVRERALERLVRLVGDDEKQAELLEFLEPLMDDLASEERTVREEARTEVRKLLRR
ncbi:MAG: hypothetical protein V3S24_02600, partial [Candidatus Tectomicrobia bacterium]